MKIAYFDCQSGISGDMTLGALVDAGVSLDALNEAIGSLGLPGLHLTLDSVKKKGFRAAQVTVHYEPEHVHRHLADIEKLIDESILTDRQKSIASHIFGLVADAEAIAHGTSRDHVHFHEVGAADSIADIVGTAVGLDLLGVERIIASAVPTGTGKVKIAHGLCSVPAPATAELFRMGKIPVAESAIRHELTTPTGAAILASQVDEFGPVPPMTIDAIGYGAGTLDLDEQPNVLRLLVGTVPTATQPQTEYALPDEDDDDTIWQLETNLDDCSGEWIGHCSERLMKLDGVLDVFSMPIQMKKQRPGVKLTVLCREKVLTEVEAVLFAETTTIGVRRWPVLRTTLQRTALEIETPWGMVVGKQVELPGGQLRFAPEYESCREIAARCDLALPEVYETVRAAFAKKQET